MRPIAVKEVGVDVLEEEDEDGLLPPIVLVFAIPDESDEGGALVRVEEERDAFSNKCHRYKSKHIHFSFHKYYVSNL